MRHGRSSSSPSRCGPWCGANTGKTAAPCTAAAGHNIAWVAWAYCGMHSLGICIAKSVGPALFHIILNKILKLLLRRQERAYATMSTDQKAAAGSATKGSRVVKTGKGGACEGPDCDPKPLSEGACRVLCPSLDKSGDDDDEDG